MIEEVCDTLTDYTVGKYRPSIGSLIAAVSLVLGAILLFTLIYVRRKEIVKQRDELETRNIAMAGQLDLKRRCLEPNGSIRQSIFEQLSDVECRKNEQTEKTASDQIFEALTSGKLVKMINNFHVKTKRATKQQEQNLSPMEHFERQKEAHYSDPSVNPLYQLQKSGFADANQNNDESSNDETSSGCESNDDEASSDGESNDDESSSNLSLSKSCSKSAQTEECSTN